MGDLIRYPVMKTVKDAAAIYGLPPTYIRTLCRTGKIRYVVADHRWLVNMNSLAQYFERGDPIPAEQGEAVGGIRRAQSIFFSHAAEQEGVIRYLCLSDQRHRTPAISSLPLFSA